LNVAADKHGIKASLKVGTVKDDDAEAEAVQGRLPSWMRSPERKARPVFYPSLAAIPLPTRQRSRFCESLRVKNLSGLLLPYSPSA